jgi:hypothetical protein
LLLFTLLPSAPFLKYGIQRNAADAVGASVDDPKPTVSPEG